MSSYLIQLLIWAGLAYLLGCYLGCWFRKMGSGADVPPPVTKTVTPPPPVKKPEMPAVAKAAIPAAAAIATAAVVKEVVKPKAPPPPLPPPPRPVAPPPPPRPVVAPVVAKVEPVKVITREMHTKADPLPTVRAATTTLPNHLTRKAEEIHHDKNVRHVDGGADRVLEKRVGTTTRVTETRTAETRPAAVAETRRVVAEPVRVAPAAAPARAVAPAPVTTPVTKTVEVGGMSRPKGIASARGNRPDDLQRISGVGPKNEKILQKLGFYHFDQIAAWSESEASWVDDHLKFGGRVRRENWIHQASLLASGKEAEFLKQYGTGGLKNSSGDKVSGSKTRK
jgi:predicted flap endonuclease-1-like 5' DNA nuclease